MRLKPLQNGWPLLITKGLLGAVTHDEAAIPDDENVRTRKLLTCPSLGPEMVAGHLDMFQLLHFLVLNSPFLFVNSQSLVEKEYIYIYSNQKFAGSLTFSAGNSACFDG